MSFNFDWLLGPRDCSVVDDGSTGTADDIEAIPTSAVHEDDAILYEGLRWGRARAVAKELRTERRMKEPDQTPVEQTGPGGCLDHPKSRHTGGFGLAGGGYGSYKICNSCFAVFDKVQSDET